MAKWYGKVGYITEVETSPGIWDVIPVERSYYGDAYRVKSKWSPSSGNLNDNLTISNQISIVADPFAYQHFSSIKYVEFMDAVWEVDSIEPQYPRLILNIGGLWNGRREADGTANEAGEASGN